MTTIITISTAAIISALVTLALEFRAPYYIYIYSTPELCDCIGCADTLTGARRKAARHPGCGVKITRKGETVYITPGCID